ncbi:DUF6173 family protein [Brevundimonas sp.]|uniref:DUF6173 family protein n=1 Tax=Brevundimonas sp. TaxID=1871086 RepID=UPI0025FB64D6|nr:DUF6173 family protein [Brevundimonas sp.]
MTERPTTEQLKAMLAENPRIDAPSAAAAGQADCPDCPVPLTAWSGDDDSQALADGLRMQSDPAQWTFARLSRLIADFESKLDEDHEVGARIVNGPGDIAFAIQDVGFWGPDLLIFMGVNDHGRPVRMIQHHTQLNVMLSALPKPKPEEPPRRIGFQLRERAEKAQAEG